MGSLSFLQSGGEMGKAVRAIDWSRTPLGPIDSWPQSLRTSISLCLASNFPIAIAWGPQRIQIYNDGYWPICGAKHPHAMGQDFKECWFSAWPVIGAAFEEATAGRSAFLENQRLFIDRNGYLEEAFFTFSFSPIRDDTGQVAGLFHPVTELTQASLATRRLTALQEVADHTAATTVAEACGLIADALNDHDLDLPFVLLYLLDRDGGQARLMCTTGLDPESAACPRLVDLVSQTGHWPLAEAARSGQSIEVADLERFGLVSCRPYPEPPNAAFVLPLRAGLDHPLGLLVAGVSARRAVDDPYRAFYALLRESVTTALTKARAYEEERVRAEALAEIDRTKTRFFSNVSHEFRTPLTLMLGPTEEALASPDRALTGENLAIVHRNELRLLKLVNTLLDFARIEAGRAQASYEPTDLAELTMDLASAFRSAIERAGLRFDVDCPPLAQPVYVDRDMWEKIVLNLVSNALKFTFEGTIRVALLEREGRAELEVRDTGVGIPHEELPRLFERFHRVQNTRSRTHEGSGIGLALVNELAKLHGGTLSVSSAVDAGTTFTVAIPTGTALLTSDRIRAAPTAASTATGATPYVEEALRWLPTEEDGVAARQASPLPAAPTSGRPVRIVLADDNADMRDYVRRILGDRWTIDAFGDGLAALEAIRANPPAVVIADVMMPGLDGLELLREVRANPETKHIPVVILSARAGEEARIGGFQAGADDYIAKPFSARELKARVEAQILRAEIRHVEEAHARRLVNVFKHAPVAIAIFRGPEHVYEFANEPYMVMIGQRGILGKPIREALPELATQGIFELLDGVYTSGQPFIAESLRAMVNRGADGAPEEGFFKFVFQPMLDDRGRAEGIVVVGIEVTALAGARRDAESASRAKDEFIAMLSHELRNPLSPILTALQLMRLRGIDGAERERTIIERQVKHLVALVDDLLDVSRITTGKVDLDRAPVELADVIAKAVETTSPLLEQRQHTLDIDVARRGLSVDADADRLAQVVTNLLTNAAKYTEPEGHIRVAAERAGESVVLTVQDTGIGIEADLLPKVFDLFAQAKQTSDRSSGGLGLGLAIVRSLLTLHGGTVRVSSDGRGRGTTFTVQLPFAPIPGDERRDEGVQGEVRPRAGDGSRVLVVDDNEDSAEMVAAALTALGHETRIALDGPSALNVVKAFQPDVGLLDIGLPGMDGHELARRLKAEPGTQQIRLVAVTGYGQPRDRIASTEAGFDAHLVKPIDLDELLRILTTLTKPTMREPRA